LLLAAFADPASNAVTFYSAYLVPIAGPHVCLLGLLVLTFAVRGMRRGPRSLSIVVAAVAALSLLVSVSMTAVFVYAVDRAGGSADPITGLWLGPPASPPPDERVVYRAVEGQDLEALVFRPVDTATEAPVMLYVHGGGWVSGEAGQTAGDFRWFADRGWLVVSIEYRLADSEHATWDLAPQDVACALGWVARHAKRYGGDPERILLAGDSAGGNLALNTGYGAALGQTEASCGGTVPVPAAVVALYPVVDPADAFSQGYPLKGLEPRKFVTQYVGGTPERFPDRTRAVSSRTYLSKDAPPTLIVEPEKDGLIPSAGVFRFVSDARAAGVDVSLARIPYSNHGFDKQAARSLGNQARRTIMQHYARNVGLLRR
jgi:acetyl esterase/lipase